MKARRILVTGAQGFLGRYLVADWLGADPHVNITGIGRSGRLDAHFTHNVHWGESGMRAPLPVFLTEKLHSDRYRYRTLDMADMPSLTQVITDTHPDIVVHLAASLRDDPPTQLVRGNIGTVVSLFESVSMAGLESARVVLGSSGSVYGYVPGRVPPFREDAVCAPIEPYSATKRAAEILSRILADQYHVSRLCVRIFNPVGPGQDERHLCGALARQVAAIAKGVRPPVVSVGTLDTTRDFIDVRDTAMAIRLVATRGQPGTTYNVASGRETTGQQILDTLLSLAGLKDRVLIERQPNRFTDMSRHYADVTRLAALGHSPRYSLCNSLAHVLDYYSECVAQAFSAKGAV